MDQGFVDPDADYVETPERADGDEGDEGGAPEPEAEPELDIEESPQEIVKKVLMTNKIFKVKLTGRESVEEPEPVPEEPKKEPEPVIVEEKFYEHKACEGRLEKLATFNVKGALETLERYKDTYSPEMYEAFKKRIQEMMAKNPGQIEADFLKLADEEALRKYKAAMDRQKRKEFQQKIKDEKKKSMLNILQGALSKQMMKAFFNPKQVIMNGRMRRVSNIVLKELSNIRGIPVPDRDSNSLRSQLMFSVSDTLAFYIDSLYFELQHQKVSDYDNLMTKQPQQFKCVDEPDYDLDRPNDYKPEKKKLR